jgi:hypothetical protein
VRHSKAKARHCRCATCRSFPGCGRESRLGRSFTSDDDLHSYRDHFSYIKDQPNELIPAAAVGPDTTEQVQAIVRIANEFKIPLYAISTGKNFAYGGPAPNVRGSVTVDLKRMNRILEVDDKRNFALVEPGVSYIDLYRHIQERGLKVWIDTPDPGWGSLIGNALDHGIGYTMGFYRDHFGAHCGMEVVLPNGELMRTGMGAMPTSEELAGVPARLRAGSVGAVRPGQFRHRHEDGLPADAAAGALAQRPDHRAEARRISIPLIEVVNYLTDLFDDRRALVRQPAAARCWAIPSSAPRQLFNEGEMDRLAARRTCTPGRSSCSSTGPSARRSRTGSTRRNWSRKVCPEARGSRTASRCRCR